MRAVLLRVARWAWVGRLLGWVFASMSFALPVERVAETRHWLAFEHPQPVYARHILLVPKRAIANLMSLQAADADFLAEGLALAQTLVVQLGLEADGYRVIVNGGAYQEVGQLHVHLVSGAMRETGLR
ncbi:MAG: hypothetical protein OHK0052_27300 [Anaerolineales bacterium]